MRVRGIEIEAEMTGDRSTRPLLWGHALMGSMSQEDEAGVLPWTGLGESNRLVRWDARGHGASERIDLRGGGCRESDDGS